MSWEGKFNITQWYMFYSLSYSKTFERLASLNYPLFNSVTTRWLYKDNCTKSNILTWCKMHIVLNFHFKGVWLLKRHAQKLTLSSVTLTIFLRVKFLPFVYSRVIYWTLKNMKQSFNVQFFLAHEREFFQWVVGIHVNYLFQA